MPAPSNSSTSPLRPGYTGVFTALVTPMRVAASSSASPGAPPLVDEAALSALVEAQLAGGIAGLVACGTTGEAAALTPVEQERVIRVVCEAAAGRVPVLAGVGSPSTAHSVELARAALSAGADGLLAVTPYYNRPPQEGLFQHYKELCSLHRPIMLYNVPARTGCDLLPETVARLCALPEVVSLKEASGSVQRTEQIVRKLGDRLTVLSGEDALNYPLYCVGARGSVSVVSNVAPRLTVDVFAAAERGDHRQAAALHHRFVPLAEALFSEPNPIPTKAALAFLTAGAAQAQIQPLLRLPLVPMTESGQARLRALLFELGLIDRGT